MNELIFDEVAWKTQCKQAADNALVGSGLSETLFAQKLYSEIHIRLGQVASEHHTSALRIAREYGYLDAVELEADSQWNAEHGYCSHGIKLNHCPVGCETDGEYE